jgi:hypothetical protein
MSELPRADTWQQPSFGEESDEIEGSVEGVEIVQVVQVV